MIRQDVLVVGGGLAGLSAALAGDPKLRVAVLSRVHPLRSHSVAAQGGINAALGNHPQAKDDGWERHAFDTIKGSDYLADQDRVELMCRKAVPTLYELESLGVPFSRFPGGVIAQRPFGGAGYPRTCYAADRTGMAILHTLYEQTVRKQVVFYGEWLVCGLVVREGRCLGVVVCDLASGEFFPIQATAVVFCTGGYGRVYLKTTNAYINQGSGIGIAYRAGVPLKDMEFVQFHPTALHGTNILMTEGARGEGGTLVNGRGRRFMEDYAPSAMELAPRDIVSRAIQSEIDKGNGIEGQYVHLDLRHLGRDKILKRLPGIREICIHFAGLDPVEAPIPILPAQHYSMGGIDTDADGASAAAGFFAAGECACVSVHGANRLGGNSLLDTVVFGRIAGEAASRFAGGSAGRDGDEAALLEEARAARGRIEALRGGGPGQKVHRLVRRLKAVMTGKVGIFRNEKDLAEALAEIRSLREDSRGVRLSTSCLRYSQELVDVLELDPMLDVAEAITLGALNRKETRGSHFRTDFRERDDKDWLRHTLVVSKDGKPRVLARDVNLGRHKPEARKY